MWLGNGNVHHPCFETTENTLLWGEREGDWEEEIEFRAVELTGSELIVLWRSAGSVTSLISAVTIHPLQQGLIRSTIHTYVTV